MIQTDTLFPCYQSGAHLRRCGHANIFLSSRCAWMGTIRVLVLRNVLHFYFLCNKIFFLFQSCVGLKCNAFVNWLGDFPSHCRIVSLLRTNRLDDRRRQKVQTTIFQMILNAVVIIPPVHQIRRDLAVATNL